MKGNGEHKGTEFRETSFELGRPLSSNSNYRR